MIRIKFKKSHPLKIRKRLRNKARIRKKIFGTKEKPRLNIFRSGKHIYAQLIDDSNQVTIKSYSSLNLKEKLSSMEKAKKVGESIGKQALDKKIKQVIFDRGGFVYHGRVKALAEGARFAGLKF
ncbi:MAG: 50S ribosomal protein L18 [Bdellovibrionaceae bacterium]|nr:50S ribosomal protein L18 [Pseudobdellovibrionaceae bacterium]